MTDWLTWLLVVYAFSMTVLYYKEQQYRRDVSTDLVQLVYDYDIDRDELRRSLGYDEIEDYFENRN